LHAKIENVAKSCNITTLETAQNIELHVFWVFRKLLEAVKKSCKSCKNLPWLWVQKTRNQKFSAVSKKSQGEFLARSHTISSNKRLSNTSWHLCQYKCVHVRKNT